MVDHSWRREAACSGTSIDFFTSNQQERYRARQLCMSECPVRRECMSYALDNWIIDGIWGGVDDYQLRRSLSVDRYGEPLKRRHPPRCPLCLNRNLEVVEKKRSTIRVRCEGCDLSWRMKRVSQRRASSDASAVEADDLTTEETA